MTCNPKRVEHFATHSLDRHCPGMETRLDVAFKDALGDGTGAVHTCAMAAVETCTTTAVELWFFVRMLADWELGLVDVIKVTLAAQTPKFTDLADLGGNAHLVVSAEGRRVTHAHDPRAAHPALRWGLSTIPEDAGPPMTGGRACHHGNATSRAARAAGPSCHPRCRAWLWGAG